MEPDNNLSSIKTCFLSNYPPKECGIATFTRDLSEAMDKRFNPKLKSKVIALDDGENSYEDKVIMKVDQLQSILFQFVGIYLLVSGIMSLIWGFSNRRRLGLWILAGTLGLAGGITFLRRPTLEGTLSTSVLALIFGLIMLLAGLIHILGGFQLSEVYSRRWLRGHFFLGLVEIVIGLLIFVSIFITVENLRIILSLWGLVAGIGLIADGVRMRKLKNTLEDSRVSQTADLKETDSVS